MKSNVNPIVIGIAVVALIVFCVFMYNRAVNSDSPKQLPPPSDTFKPGYDGGGKRPRPGQNGTPAPGGQ
jgi:hypothetical protein